MTSILPSHIEWTSNGTPMSRLFNDVYFSTHDGLAESNYVFLSGNNLPTRFKQCKEFYITELGFGTGLNFLACWQLWHRIAKKNAILHYYAIDRYPLTSQDMKKALAVWPTLTPFAEKLLNKYPNTEEGEHTIIFDNGRVKLHLIWEDASKGILGIGKEHLVDAWFLDGFTPSKNPEMWRDDIFINMGKKTVQGGSFATFTAAGNVKRGLNHAGFQIEKKPGFGMKREMMCGIFASK